MKKRKLLTIMMLIVAVSIPVFAKKKAVKVSNKVIIKKQTIPSPDWIYQEKITVKKDKSGKKYLYLLIESTQDSQKKAEMDVKATKSMEFARLINEFTVTEMILIEPKMKDEFGNIKPYYSEIVYSICRNVDTSGLQIADSYWEIWKVKENGKHKQVYRVMKLYRILYSEFQEKLLKETSKESPKINQKLNQRSEEFIKKFTDQLNSI